MASVAENLFKNVKTTMKVVEITPDMAAAWLRRNPRNRSISPKRVDKYAESIINGHWKMAYDPIRFDEKGVLLDGQHRLSAIVLSGQSIRALVITGIDSDVFDVLDSGAFRSGADVLTIDGLPRRVARAVSAAAGLVDSYEQTGKLVTRQIKKELLREFVSQRPGIISAAEYLQVLPSRNTPLADGCGTFLRYKTAPLDKELSDYFFQALYTGANLPHGDMILHLRDIIYFDKSQGKVGKLNSYEHVGMCIKVWNALRQDRTIKYKGNIRFRQNDSFPEVK